MIQVKDFTLEVLKTHKAFFLLDALPKSSSEVDVWVQTPAGLESVDFIDVFTMQDGSLLAAWKHPYQKLPLHSLTAFCNGKTQILNLNPVERMIEIYDRPINSNYGTFTFTKSKQIGGEDWRCDRSMYGPQSFQQELVNRVIEQGSELVFYEPFLSVNGVAHLIYLEATGKSELAVEKLNNSIAPTTTRTLQECLRLIYEWSVLAQEPFNAIDDCSVSSNTFLNKLLFNEKELEVLESLPQMQISQFLSGSENARQRPHNIASLSTDVEEILWRRMASSSLSFIAVRNPNIWDFDEILQEEERELASGIARFRDFYGIPEYEPLDENGRAVEFAEIVTPKHGGYVQTQLRGFRNKRLVMDKAIALHQ